MSFRDFYQRFGGSFRTKHLNPIPQGFASRAKWCWRFLTRRADDQLLNKRMYAPPKGSILPKDFIRLEPWEAEYLYLLATQAKKCICEVGRFHGGSTFLMAWANRNAPIYSIDIQPQNDKRLKAYLNEQDIGDNVHLIVGDSQNTDYPEIGEIDLLFIDGDHSYEGCTNDLKNWFGKVSPGGHVVLHDCYFGSDVQSSVIDFIGGHDVRIIRSPYIIDSHWNTSYGSMAHFMKSIQSAARAA